MKKGGSTIRGGGRERELLGEVVKRGQVCPTLATNANNHSSLVQQGLI